MQVNNVSSLELPCSNKDLTLCQKHHDENFAMCSQFASNLLGLHALKAAQASTAIVN